MVCSLGGMNMVTDKQEAFIAKLAAGRALHPMDQELVENVQCLTRKDASALIDRLLAAPKKSLPAPYTQALEVGMYRTTEGDILRVYLGQQSGMNLVKRVVGTPASGYSYDYVGSAHRVSSGKSVLGIVEVTRLTLEEAKSWGKMTGHCIVCGRRLDDPVSVDAGIGPVCAKKFS